MKSFIQKTMAAVIALVMISIALLIVYTENGLKDLFLLYREEKLILARNKTIEQENRALAVRIMRLKKDMDFIEHLARHELGMAGKDELVFKITKQEPLEDNAR